MQVATDLIGCSANPGSTVRSASARDFAHENVRHAVVGKTVF